MVSEYKIMIVAGEASGDAHGAKLVNALREWAPDITFFFFGAAGHKMRAAGVEAIVNSDNLSIVGLPEIARSLPLFLKAFRDLKEAATTHKADAVILVDFPDFNLRLAKSLKRRGLTVIYYISPQLWAWRKYRLRTIRDHVDLLITILPFEKDWYSKNRVFNVEYVGSPLAREVHADLPKAEFCIKHGLKIDKPIISLLPGSRHKEIVRILPVMLETAAQIAEREPEIQFMIALASVRDEKDLKTARLTAERTGLVLPKTMVTIHNETYDALNASDAAAVTSGTATLETGIIGTPMAIVYKTSNFNYRLMRPMISVEHFGLINLIAGKRVAKELIQHDFTAATLANELFRLIEPTENRRIRTRLREAADSLGHGGASKRAAEAILKILEPTVKN